MGAPTDHDLLAMRKFASGLPRDLGPLFGRDVVRLIDEVERLRGFERVLYPPREETPVTQPADYTLTVETLRFDLRGPEDELKANEDRIAAAMQEAEELLRQRLPMFDVRVDY